MEIIKQSFFEVIRKSIEIEAVDSIMPIKRGFLVSIDKIEKQNTKRVFLIFNTSFLRTMCELFLSNKNPSKPMLEDMAKELANLTVGHAKVIAQEKNKNFNISTPSFLGFKAIANYDHGIHFRLRKNGHCSIFMRETQEK